MKHTIKKQITLIIIFLISYNYVYSQCYTKNTSFKTGEKITYDVYYNWAFIWLNAGEVYFKVGLKKYNNKPVYHFESFGRTHEKYDWIFKVRDKYETIADTNTFNPLIFKRNTYEGGYYVKNKYYFDHSENKIFTFTENTKKSYTQDTLALPKCTFDVLTTIYYSRNIDYSKHNINDKIPLSLIIDNEVFDLYIKYLGKDTIKTKDGIIYNCIKFKPLLVEGTIFSGGENMTVWVSDDENKIPILVEAKILVGTVKAFLTDYENIRYELEFSKQDE
ncbi:MAG: DUF3108 domain-containing protein [Bacteroidales bacterium]|nr:DUF3108 domain-containing protein [Bacteroidales bacterium]